MTAIEVRGLTRDYRVRGRTEPVHALSDFTLDIARGSVHGLLGPNGAGKTTLCKILSTILTPTTGTARVCGFDVVTEAARVRERIGLVLGGDRGLYARLTARENLEFWTAMYGMPRAQAAARIDEVVEQVGLADVDLRVERFSRGMKQRLHLARGLLARPEVLVLDEPTVGMDPVAARAFRDLVREAQAGGATILLTTHDMAEAEALCDAVSMIDGGRLITTATPSAISELLTAYERIDVQVEPGAEAQLSALVASRSDVAAVSSESGRVRIETAGADAVSAVLGVLLAEGFSQVSVSRPSLEEVYVHVIGDRGMGLR